MKKQLLFMFMAMYAIIAFANGDINGDGANKKIDITQTSPPMPRFYNVEEPEVVYNVSAINLSISLDLIYYSEYTIHLVGEYVEMDYFVYTPVVYIPVATFGEIIDIYIESDDCGCYYGTLDQSAYINTYK